jgi:hypothetical protein
MILQRYKLHLISGHHEEPECIIDMVPRNGVRATIHKKQSFPGDRKLVTPAVRPQAAAREVAGAGACPWHAGRMAVS